MYFFQKQIRTFPVLSSLGESVIEPVHLIPHILHIAYEISQSPLLILGGDAQHDRDQAVHKGHARVV